jgi:predicted Zn-dependent protease
MGVILIASVLTYLYRTKRLDRAEEEFQTGIELAATGREAEAVEHFRNALSVSHSFEHRLALAMALVKIGRVNEARIYLNDLSRENPASAMVNLGLARAAAAENNVPQATSYYRRAIYGTWGPDADKQRITARLELAIFLTDKGARTPAVTELQSLLEEVPRTDETLRNRAALLLMKNGAAAVAAEVFRELAKAAPKDPEAQQRLADAEFALGNYGAAGAAYREAVRLNPSDNQAAVRAKLSEQIVSLDPSIRGLSARVRYQRSQALVYRVLEAAKNCVPKTQLESWEKAAAEAFGRRRPASYSDSAEENVALAVKLWKEQSQLCPATTDENPLNYLVRKLSP